MADLTLPGSIPGLLRRGSPLYVQGVVVGINPEMEDNLTHLVCLHEGNQDFCDPAGLELDLSDATGRAHAAWWLARKVGLKQDGERIQLASAGAIWVAARYLPVDWRTWALCTWNQNHLAEFQPVATCNSARSILIEVPSLATLDPNDPRTLPDGSRWVDAEALRLVCLHVAGMGGE